MQKHNITIIFSRLRPHNRLLVLVVIVVLQSSLTLCNQGINKSLKSEVNSFKRPEDSIIIDSLIAVVNNHFKPEIKAADIKKIRVSTINERILMTYLLIQDSIAVFCTQEGFNYHIFGININKWKLEYDIPYVQYDWFINENRNELVNIQLQRWDHSGNTKNPDSINTYLITGISLFTGKPNVSIKTAELDLFRNVDSFAMIQLDLNR